MYAYRKFIRPYEARSYILLVCVSFLTLLMPELIDQDRPDGRRLFVVPSVGALCV